MEIKIRNERELTEWESLDEARVKEIEAKWAAESEERIDAVDRGELQTIDGPSALQELRSSLRK